MSWLTWPTNRPVSYEVLSSGNDYDHVRFLAQDVPSVGYKAYAIKSTSESPAARLQHWEGRSRTSTTAWSWIPKAER